MAITLTINRKKVSLDIDSNTPLLWALRDHVGLLGTKFGCGIAQCGACTVWVNGEATRSCVLPISAVANTQITTIEGLDAAGKHPIQEAWDELDVAQCGYCQAGQIMTAAALLKKNPHPSKQEIVDGMAGNICRCGTYHRIQEAVALASKKFKIFITTNWQMIPSISKLWKIRK
jgi:isoquinoline 1-oxidoreductase alpha subunit